MATYSTTPIILLGELREPPEYRHKALQRYYLGIVREHFTRQRSLSGFVDAAVTKVRLFWDFFCGPLLALPFVAMLLTLRGASSRFALLGSMTVVWALAHVTWAEPHYLAPVAGIFYLLPTQGARFVVAARPFRSWIGPVFAPAFVAALGLTAGATLCHSATVSRSARWSHERAEIVEHLMRIGGQHLVLISDSDTSPLADWVDNAADIDSSPVVWARDSIASQTARLLNYYSGRQVWRLRVAGRDIELVSADNSDPPARSSVN